MYPKKFCEDNPLEGDEQLYPEDSQIKDDPLRFDTSEEVAYYLWREEKVPEWIDDNVESEDG